MERLDDSEEELLEKSASSEKDLTKISEDNDDLLLLSSPSPSPKQSVSAHVSGENISMNKQSKKKSTSEISEIVNIDDDEVEEEEDQEIEIVNEVKSVPGVSFSASESSEESEEINSEEEDLEESDDTHPFEGGKINIFYSHGSFFLWNIDDIQMLREECRIIGKLGGCLPRAPRQNVQLGLPLQLMPEEVKLLVDIDAAVLVVEKPLLESEPLFKSRLAAFENVRRQNFQIQQGLYKEQRKKDVGLRLLNIIAGKKAKKRKLEEKAKSNKDKGGPATTDQEPGPAGEKVAKMDTSREAADLGAEETCASTVVPGADSNKRPGESTVVAPDKNDKVSEEVISTTLSNNAADPSGNKPSPLEEQPRGTVGETTQKDKADDNNDNDDDDAGGDEDIDNLTVEDIITSEISVEHSLVQLFTESPWKQSVLPYRGWKFPSSEREFLRYHVFKDLWSKGFFLTSGTKFGGDFLVYPGDPARYHSHYIVVCRSQFDETPCLDLIALGRLASNVRKTALMCALDRNRKVTYTSLQWADLG